MPVGRDSPSRRFAWLACGLLALVTAGPIVAQEAPSGAGIAPANYDNPDEIKQLDGVVRSLGGAEGDTADPQHVKALLELSELLSSPCDQLRWLLAQTTSLNEPRKSELATPAVTRGDGFTKDEQKDCQAELAQLRSIARPPPPVPDPTKSSITAEPAQVEANGKDPATVIVTLRDSQQQPVAKYDVSLAPVAGVTIDPPVRRSDDAGVARFTVTSAKEQEAQFVATDPKGEAPTKRTGIATVKFTPPPRLPLDQVVEANALKNRLAEPQAKGEAHALPEAGKFALLARGVDDALIFDTGPTNPLPAWDTPRAVLDELARTAELPKAGAGKLLELRQRLVKSYAAAPGAQERATFAIAAALLDRALGLDETDLATAVREPPFDYKFAAQDWAALADVLEKDSLWRWAALARLLQAASLDGTQRRTAAESADKQWSYTRQVLPTEHWGAVDDWILKRLPGPDPTTTPNMLPLRPNFRAGARARRAFYEKIIADTPKTNGNADKLLENIQLAKAADLLEYISPAEAAGARTVVPLKPDELIKRVKLPNESCVFIELFELPSATPGGPASFCGVALTKVGSDPVNPVVVEGALASVVRTVWERLPKEGRGVRIVIAPDGALPLAWFQTECELLPFAEKALTYTGWVVYVPSAPALTASAWTLDKTLRVWYRTALRAGNPAPVLPLYPQRDPPPLTAPRLFEPADGDKVSTYPVWLGERARLDTDVLLKLLDEKREHCPGQKGYEVVPLVVSKSG